MSTLFARRFKEARLLNGYSLQQLADELESRHFPISKQALHKYEKGEAMPDSPMLEQISRIMGLRVDFFFQPEIIELSTPEFRKLKKLPAKEQDRIIEHTRFAISRYVELENILQLSVNFINPLKDLQPIHAGEEADAAAEKVRQAWNLGMGPIYNVLELLEDNHIKVVMVESKDSFDGLQAWVNNQQIAVIALNSSRLSAPDRLRFTALHELGHLLLPIDHLPEKERERMCNRFAAAMLLPAATARVEFGENRKRLHVQELADLKKQYGISIQALAYRANDLGIISDAWLKQFIFMMVRQGWRQTEPVQYAGQEKSNRFNQLLMRALAEELVSMDKAAALSNLSLIQFRKQLQMVE